MTYERCVLFNLMADGMLTGDLAAPKAVLTHLVVVAFLAFVPEADEIFTLARVTLNLMHHFTYYGFVNRPINIHNVYHFQR